jgi:hypothetical protein
VRQNVERSDGSNDDEEPVSTTIRVTCYCHPGQVNNSKIALGLADAVTFYSIISEDCYRREPIEAVTTFILERYSATTLQGIMPDIGVATWSTAGEHQFEAFCRQDSGIQLDRSTEVMAKITFG